jgi:gamma-glutamylcyclotransferase (GGCT)/AIG2-like uncharacterized protein YtfP
VREVKLEQLPFFFYGTLRPGEHNYGQLLKGRTSREEAGWWLPNAALYLYASGDYSHLKDGMTVYQPSGSYPYMVEGNGRVAGHLVEVRPELYETLLPELDWLEGFSEDAPEEENEYLRIVREIEHESGKKIRAWVYLAAPHAFARQRSKLTAIESGDWLEWRARQLQAEQTQSKEG